MPKNILHHNGKFMEWTTIADGPCTQPMDFDQMFDYLWRASGYPYLPEPIGIPQETREDRRLDMEAERAKILRRLHRARRMGTSCMLQTEPLREVYVQDEDRDVPLGEVFRLCDITQQPPSAEPDQSTPPQDLKR